MSDNQNQSHKSDWKPAIVTLILGALITLGTTWYTIYEGKKQAMQAEDERYRKVQDNLVSIIEEHIVNQRILNLNALQRLIEIQIKDEKLAKPISLWDILSQAEYNILNSRHLDIKKKEEYEKSLTKIYETFNADSLIDVSKYAEAELIKSVMAEINRSNNKEATKLLVSLIERYETKVKEESSKSEINLFDFVLDKPSLVLITSGAYLTLAIFYFTYYRNRVQRRRREEFFIRKELEIEKLRLEEEIKLLTIELEKEVNDETKEMIKERLKMLQERLEYLLTKYNYRQQKL